MSGLPPTFDFRTERTARYARLGPDPGGAPPELRSAWVVLHGYRQLAPWFLRHFRGLDDGSRLLVAPEALSRFYLGDPDGRHGADARVGATWMTREARKSEIRDYTRYLNALSAAVLPDRVPRVVLGFSQGAHTAARWVLSGEGSAATPEVTTDGRRTETPDRVALPTAPRAVILWGEGLPHDVDTRALERSSVERWIFVRGESDPSRDPRRETRDAELCKANGVESTVVSHSGGHALDAELLIRLAGELEG